MKKINTEIRNLVLEICLVLVFTIVSIPLWDYIGNSSLGEVAEHYSKASESNIVITNSKKYIYAESFQEAIGEKNTALITSYEENSGVHSIYLTLKLGTNYDDILFSNGSKTSKLSDLYDSTSDYIYFKVDEKETNSKETLTYYYYIWTKNLEKDRNVKVRFAIL